MYLPRKGMNIQLFADPGAKEVSLQDIEDYLNGISQDTPPATDDNQNPPASQPVDDKKKVDDNEKVTQIVARRLKEEAEKIRAAERDAIAKEFKHESWDAYLKAKEQKALEEKGYDPKEISPMIDEMLKQRMDADPRLKELEELRAIKREAFAKKELAELSQVTLGKITKLEDIPKDVADVWRKGTPLKQAYLALHGEKLVNELRKNGGTNTTTAHLYNPSGTSVDDSAKGRPLTEQEKYIAKIFNPELTDEQLAKKIKKEE